MENGIWVYPLQNSTNFGQLPIIFDTVTFDVECAISLQ